MARASPRSTAGFNKFLRSGQLNRGAKNNNYTKGGSTRELLITEETAKEGSEDFGIDFLNALSEDKNKSEKEIQASKVKLFGEDSRSMESSDGSVEMAEG